MTIELIEQTQEQSLFNREDFAFNISYEKFLKSEPLHEHDFASNDAWTRYFLLDLELVNWAVVIVSGKKRSGKSCLGTWLAYELKRLFDKGVTMNYHPKPAFGKYDYITELSFLEEWVKLTELADREDSLELINNLAALTEYSKFYNRTLVIDEAKKWVWRRKSNSRLVMSIGELTDLAGHNHNVMLFMCPDAEMVVDRVAIWEGRTHEVYCSFNTTYWGCASYMIRHVNTGKTRWMHLPVKKFAHLWESENIIAMSRPITKKQMDEAQARARGDYAEIERAVGKHKPDIIIGGNK